MKSIIKAIARFSLVSLLSGAYAGVATSGMSREKFQSTVHTLVDDEVAFLLESSRIMSQGSTSMESATKSSLRKHAYTSNETDELDRFFASVVQHGWDTILERSSDSDLFLVCNDSPSVGDAGLQEILDALEVDPVEHGGGFETVHSSLDSLCIVVSISLNVALNWRNAPNNSSMTLIPWVDVMKLSYDILPQILEETASTPSYSIIASTLTTDRVALDGVLKDVQRLTSANRTSRRQQVDSNELLEAFSITKMKKYYSSNESRSHWSRMLSHKDDCSSMLDNMVATPLHGENAYQFHFEEPTTEACMILFVVALAVRKSVARVGTMNQKVELHNLNANWIVQGRSQDSQDNEILPFSAAGLDGKSQVVAISDTGLDVNNCYFRDSASIDSFGQDSIFETVSTVFVYYVGT